MRTASCCPYDANGARHSLTHHEAHDGTCINAGTWVMILNEQVDWEAYHEEAFRRLATGESEIDGYCYVSQNFEPGLVLEGLRTVQPTLRCARLIYHWSA